MGGGGGVGGCRSSRADGKRVWLDDGVFHIVTSLYQVSIEKLIPSARLTQTAYIEIKSGSPLRSRGVDNQLRKIDSLPVTLRLAFPGRCGCRDSKIEARSLVALNAPNMTNPTTASSPEDPIPPVDTPSGSALNPTGKQMQERTMNVKPHTCCRKVRPFCVRVAALRQAQFVERMSS